MPQSFENEWAVALKKSKQKSTAQTAQPIKTRFKHALEEMAYKKTQLRAAMRDHNVAEMETLLRRLIELRANLAALQIERANELYGKATQQMVKRITERYARDCVRLVTATSAFV